jgi:hypothetical protein
MEKQQAAHDCYGYYECTLWYIKKEEEEEEE